jgi:hypothetical protein
LYKLKGGREIMWLDKKAQEQKITDEVLRDKIKHNSRDKIENSQAEEREENQLYKVEENPWWKIKKNLHNKAEESNRDKTDENPQAGMDENSRNATEENPEDVTGTNPQTTVSKNSREKMEENPRYKEEKTRDDIEETPQERKVESYENSRPKVKNVLEKDSIQYNCQDMDQEQNVDVNPTQTNNQCIHLTINSDKNNYSSRITGTTYYEGDKEVVPNTKIYLYFGSESAFPVYQTNSDDNGNFAVEDIPPGYYTLTARSGHLNYSSHYIKVLPGQDVYISVLLK